MSLRVAVVLKTDDGGMWTVPDAQEMIRRGHQVTFIIPGGHGRLRRRLDEVGIPVVESRFDFRYRPRPSTLIGLWRLRRQLRALAPDVVHFHLYASAIAVRLATLGWSVPLVHKVAGPLYLESRRIRMVERFFARRDTVLLAGSHHTATRYRELCGPRLPIVENAYAVHGFAPASVDVRRRARASLGLAEEAVVFVMVALVYAPKEIIGTGLGIKGHDVLFRAWPQVHAAHPTARLLLVGGGFDAPATAFRDELIREFAIDDDPSISWVETVADVRSYYAAADVSVCPSRSENHGAARESSSSGVISIVSDAGGLPETVDPADGWIVPADNVAALAIAMTDAASLGRDELHARGVRAHEREARLFDPVALTDQLVDVIEEVARRA